MQNEKVPEWAIARANELAVNSGMDDDQRPSVFEGPFTRPLQVAFARYIAEHEDPPVDELYEALKAVVEMGRYDTREQTELLRRELKDRGLEVRKIELARKEDSHAG